MTSNHAVPGEQRVCAGRRVYDAAPTILSMGEAAARLGVNPNTLLSWVERGWLHAVDRQSADVRFREADVEHIRERIDAE
jgi:hypothetical protein